MFGKLMATIFLLVIGGPLLPLFPIPFLGPIILLWLLVKVWSGGGSRQRTA